MSLTEWNYEPRQAERAVCAWITGKKMIPDGQAGWFSEDNWGDSIVYKDGRKVKKKKTSRYLRTIDTFTDVDWKIIIQEAKELRDSLNIPAKRKSKGRVRVGTAEDEAESEEEEILLSD